MRGPFYAGDGVERTADERCLRRGNRAACCQPYVRFLATQTLLWDLSPYSSSDLSDRVTLRYDRGVPGKTTGEKGMSDFRTTRFLAHSA